VNITRISGIASGIDTESIVRDMMQVERMRVDKMNQQKQIILWRQEQYNDINKDLANFILNTRKDFELTKTNSYGMGFSNSMSNMSWVKKATSSNEDIFTAKATAGAVQGTHKIRVEQLAEGVNIASKSVVKTTGGEVATSSTQLSDLGVLADDGKIVFEAKAIINGQEKIAEVEINFKNDKGEVATIGEFVKKINQATGKTETGEEIPLGIQASFDDSTGRLFLSTKATGENAQIKIIEDDQGLLSGDNNKFKLYDTLESDPLLVPQIDPETKNPIADAKFLKGQNAIIHFNGAENLEYESNNILLNGIQINLNSADPAKEYTLKVDTDIDGVYDKIKSFVDKYNELVDNLNKKTSEKRYRDYQPLTDEQKKAMNEDDVKKWEERAKSGLLRNDEIIEKVLRSVRSGLYEKVEGISTQHDHLSSIGITTGDWKEREKLVIDERKLKQAITDDVDGVLNLLFAPSDTEDPKKSGLVNRMYDDMIAGMKEIIDKSGAGDDKELYRNVQSNILIDFVTKKGSISYLDKDVIDFEKRIAEEERRLISREQSYWDQFTAMEKAISQMNSQSMWLEQQIMSFY
jgi:flagellar hook-associated protein 2